MSSLDEISVLTMKIDELRVKEAATKEVNKKLQIKLEELMREREGSRQAEASQSKLKGRSSPQQAKDYASRAADDDFIKSLLKSNSVIMAGEEELNLVYLDMLKDLKYVIVHKSLVADLLS